MTAPTSELAVGRALCRPGHDPALLNARVLVADGRIIDVTCAAGPDDGLLLLPALVDAHDHGRGLRSVGIGAPDQPLELWLPLLGLEPRVDPYLRAAVAFARNARAGIGAINHCHNPQRVQALVEEAAAVARAARDIGIRVAFAVPLRDRNYLAYGDPGPIAAALGSADFKSIADTMVRIPRAEQLAWVEAISRFEHPLFHVQYGPVGPQWCSDTLLAEIAQASARSARRVHMHLFETRRQREWADAHYPKGLVHRLDSIGLLSDRLTVAHGVWLRPDECELLAERGVTVSANTSSNLRLGSGTAPLALFKSVSLAWAMGLDGMALDDDEDGLRELRLLWHGQRGVELKNAISPAELCDAVFRIGRRTVTPEPGGAIGPGMAADLVVLDYAAMAADVLDASGRELEILLTRGRKEFVKRLIVAGRAIVDDSVLCSIDLAAAEQELLAQARAAWPVSAASIALRQRFCDALAEFYVSGAHQRAGGEPS
jgi:cytosine/adenosine deaminase-related metal-dependent hydrolase